jgi:anion-transporting  ArsA/GET3 family ATPase
MSRIITFLGKAGTGHTTLAIATAKWFAQHEKRVLFVTHNPSPSSEQLLDMPLTPQPQVVAPKLEAVQLQTTVLLEQSWGALKSFISLYLPLPSLSDEVHPGELIMLPGFDSVLAFNALCQYYMSGDYDVIVYDGRGDLETLRLLGVPHVLEWYFRRFRRLFQNLDISKVAESIGGPIASAFLSVNVDTQKIEQEMNRVRSWINEGVSVVNDPKRFTAYLVTLNEPGAIAEAKWLWGSAQQVNLRASGVLVYQHQGSHLAELQDAFEPLVVSPIPTLHQQQWEPLIQALPNFEVMPSVPDPVTIDLVQREVRVFLPGFNKKQVKLTQFGPELTVEAGDQRRNIFLPPGLREQPVQSGKFEEPYLVITF